MNPDDVLASATMPELPSWVVLRDELIEGIKESCGQATRIVTLPWRTGAGKTTLLAQFVEANTESCISFFFTSDYWRSNPTFFLSDMCRQIANRIGKAVSVDVPPERLDQLFASLLQQLNVFVARRGTPLYWVFDGLDEVATGRPGTTVLDLLPWSLGRHQYLIVGSSMDDAIPTAHLPSAVARDYTPFGRVHTSEVLRGLGLDESVIDRIHSATSGFPAYVAELRRSIERGSDPAQVVEHLPETVAGFLELEWRKVAPKPQDARPLAIIANAGINPSISVWATIAGVDPESLAALLRRFPFLRQTADGHVEFVSALHRAFTQQRTSEHQTEARIAIVDYLRSDPHSADAQALLPDALRVASSFQSLKSIIDAKFLARSLVDTRDLPLVQDTLDAGMEGAEKSVDIASATFYAIASSALRTTRGRFAQVEGEIAALCAVGDFDGALSVASAVLLPQDQLQALGAVVRGYRTAGIEPVSNIYSVMEHLADRIPQTLAPDDVARVAASFFDTKPELAIRLVERCVGGRGERALDRALLVLATHSASGTERASTHTVAGRIRDEEARSWATAGGGDLTALTADEVLEEAARLTDAPARLFLLQTWCNTQRDRASRKVIEFAFDAVEGASSYTSSLRQLRQIAEGLVGCQDGEVADLVDRLEALRDHLPQRPLQEWVRLELIVVAQTARFDPRRAAERLKQFMLWLDGQTDVDMSVYALARLLRLIGEGRGWSADHVATEDVRHQLQDAFERLIGTSADQLGLTRQALANLARVDVRFAADLANSLNYPHRRDRALREVVENGVRTASATWETVALFDTVDRIGDTFTERGHALSHLLRSLADARYPVALPLAGRAKDTIATLRDPADRAVSYVHLARWLSDGNRTWAQDLGRAAIAALELIDGPWGLQSTGFELVRHLESFDHGAATRTLTMVREQTSRTNADPYFAQQFALTVSAAICCHVVDRRTDTSARLAQLQRLIDLVPSATAQAQQLACLAARYFFAGESAVAARLMDRARDALSTSQDEYAKVHSLPVVSYGMYLTDQDGFFAALSELPRGLRDAAVVSAIHSVLLRVAPDVPVDPGEPVLSIDVEACRRAIDLLGALVQDDAVARSVELIAKCAIGVGRTATLPGKALSRFADQLDAIVDDKLPDSEAIQHDGWKLLCRVATLKMRHAAKPTGRRQADEQDWSNLLASANGIPNVADRAFVLSLIARELAPVEPELCKGALGDAEQLLGAIPSAADRVSRFESLATGYFRLDDQSSAIHHIREAWANALDLADDPSMERLLDAVLETAHAIDPALASSLTPLIDDEVRRYSVQQHVDARELDRRPTDPTLLAKATADPSMFAESAWRMRRSIAAGRGRALPEASVLHRLRGVSTTDLNVALNVVCWAGENAAIGNWPLAKRLAILDATLAGAEFVANLGEAIKATDRTITSYVDRGQVVAGNLAIFGVGERDEALAAIAEWISSSVSEYLVVIDPYFTAEDVDILKHVPPGIAVRIVADLRAQQVGSGERSRESVQRGYAARWRRIADFPPPDTDIVLLGTKTANSPLHGRHLLTANGGISVDASLNGLGVKLSTVRKLSFDEARAVEAEQLGFLSAAFPTYRGERVQVVAFQLAEDT